MRAPRRAQRLLPRHQDLEPVVRDEAAEALEPAAARRPRVERHYGLVSQTGTSWHLPNWAVE
jgi:hypothetical protein